MVTFCQMESARHCGGTRLKEGGGTKGIDGKEDHVRQWTELHFPQPQRAAEDSQPEEAAGCVIIRPDFGNQDSLTQLRAPCIQMKYIRPIQG